MGYMSSSAVMLASSSLTSTAVMSSARTAGHATGAALGPNSIDRYKCPFSSFLFFFVFCFFLFVCFHNYKSE